MLEVTPRAIEEIRKLLAQEGDEGLVLRVRVVPGGCSGYSYEMGFDDEFDESDEVVETEGIKVVVDETSAQFLKGAVLDYTDGFQGRGFSIKNPNATATCGCGSSFTV